MDISVIRSISIFESLPDSEIEHLADALVPETVTAGTLLLEEGRRDDRYLIIVEGEVEVIKALGTSDERYLGVRGPGSFLGEMSLFSEDGRHTASVRTTTEVVVLEMGLSELDGLLHRQPGFAYDMMRIMSHRLDESENLTIQDLREKNRQLQKMYDDLRAAQQEIIEKERLEREIELAREIQLSILPKISPGDLDLDFGALIEPMAMVGGDFYDLIQLDSERIGIAIGDVTDHGVPAALFMGFTATLLRVEASRYEDPQEVLESVNRHLLRMNETGMFVTLLYGVYNRRSQTLQYARAGHELPIICLPTGEILDLPLEPGQPLGLMEDLLLDVHQLDLSSGTQLLFYTDGVPNSRDPEDRLFNLSEIVELLASRRYSTSQEYCVLAMEAIERYRAGQAPYDDVTLVAFRVA